MCSLPNLGLAMENSSVSVTGAARSVRKLRIEGFSATGSMDHNEYITSRWSVDGYDWEVRIYPSLFRSVNLGLFALSGSGTSSTMVSLCCQVIDPTGKVEPSEEYRVSAKFSKVDEGTPKLHLMSRDELQTAGYLMDDTLTLQCTVTVLKELPVQFIPAQEATIAPPSSNLHQHLGELLQSEIGADVTFVVGDDSFAAHKNILAARSPVFKAQFFGDMKEKCTWRVEVKDMEAEVFRAMLRFVYTDTIPELDQPLELVVGMAQHLLAGADRYGLDRLKLICEMKLANGITIDTAATTLALAEQHNFLQCIEFIVSTPAVLDVVLATEGYEHLVTSCPSVLANLLKSARGRKN